MLSSIQISKPGSASQDAEPNTIDLLLGCHQRIRHFSGVAVRVAAARDVPSTEIVQAAEGLIRYFSIALPLHAQDEDVSIQPRLERFLPPTDLAGPAAEAMVEQHREIDLLLEQLLPLWKILKASPEKLSELAPELDVLSVRLDELFRGHLEMEEQTIFPAMNKFLPEGEMKAIAREMEERRR